MNNIRNLSDDCKKCEYADHWDIQMCFDCCSIPVTLLDEIEEERNKADAEKEDNRSDTDSAAT